MRKYIYSLILVAAIACLSIQAQPLKYKPTTASVSAGGTTTIDEIVGKVDNYIILKSEIELGVIQAQSSGEKLKGDLNCKVLEQIVLSKLMLAKAEIDSVTVEERQVDDQLDRRMQYMIQTIGSREKLEAYYKKTVDQFKSELRKQVKEQLIAQKMQESISKNIKVTPGEVKRFYNAIPKDSLPYFSKEVQVGQIVLTVKQGKAAKQEAKKRALEIKQRVLNGEDFATLAKELSEDPGSAAQGGNLGFWGKGDMVAPYEAAALALKPGQTSDVVESQFGFHIIQLIARKGAQYDSRHILIRPNPNANDKEETTKQLDSLRNLILIDSLKFDQGAKKFSDDNETKDQGGFFVDPNTNTNRVPLENLDPVIYFIIDTMQVGEITKPMPFRTADGKEAFRVVFFKAKYAPHEANLKDDYQKIYNACLLQKKQQALRTWFEKSRTEVFVEVDPQFNNCELFKDGI